MSSSLSDVTAAIPADELRALIDRAHDCERQSRRDEARALYESALWRMRPPMTGFSVTSIVRWIARTYLADAMFDEARDCLELSLAIAEQTGDVAGTGHSINQLAVLHWQLGDLDNAKRLYLTAREHATRSDDASLVAMTSTNLGVIASVRGDQEQALRYFESSLREYRLLGMSRDVCIALNNVGLVHTRLTHWDDADQAFTQALEVAHTLRDVEIATQLEINLAQVAMHRGDLDTARRLVERALLTAQAHRLGDSLGGAYKLAAAIARSQGDLDGALASLERAADVATQRGNGLLLAEVERDRSKVHRQLGRNRDALQSLNISHRLFTRLQARQDMAAIAQETRALEGDFLELARRWGESTESKDQYTQGHCERVADLSCRLAAVAGVEAGELLWFRIGALLHDVGKLIVPSEVLNKPGRLTKEEWELMKRHPIAGVELLSEVEFPWDVLPIVRSHHECWDGSGYPDGLVGEEIPMVARIVCLADVYDALTTERSYKRALPHDEAIDVMRRDAGRQFDPELFGIFERLMRHQGASALAAEPSEAEQVRERRGRATMDELTGLPTRRAFVEAARLQLSTATEASPLALAVIDVDHFKSVNDTFGHLTGDNVLEVVAKVLSEGSRPTDVVGRYAGDEFVILLPDTDASDAQRFCERLREAVGQRRIPVRGAEERWVGVSLSIGVAVAPRNGESFEDLFASADRALYEAKRRGRNAVAVASRDGEVGKPRLNVQHFVGRQAEVARLRERVEACVRGEPGLVAVIGEAGVGKTTLVQRMTSEIRLRTGTLVTARALEPDVRPPFGVWADIVSQLHQLRIVPAQRWPQLARIVPALQAEHEASGEADATSSSKYALLDELVTYIRTAAASRPLMLVLDDVQWADHASWEALEHLLGAVDHDRLLMCLTIRREDAQQFETSRRRLSRHESYRELRLERLSPSEVGEWLADILHQAEREGELAEYLYRYTEGNPLFVVQVLQTLVDEGGAVVRRQAVGMVDDPRVAAPGRRRRPPRPPPLAPRAVHGPDDDDRRRHRADLRVRPAATGHRAGRGRPHRRHRRGSGRRSARQRDRPRRRSLPVRAHAAGRRPHPAGQPSAHPTASRPSRRGAGRRAPGRPHRNRGPLRRRGRRRARLRLRAAVGQSGCQHLRSRGCDRLVRDRRASRPQRDGAPGSAPRADRCRPHRRQARCGERRLRRGARRPRARGHPGAPSRGAARPAAATPAGPQLPRSRLARAPPPRRGTCDRRARGIGPHPRQHRRRPHAPEPARRRRTRGTRRHRRGRATGRRPPHRRRTPAPGRRPDRSVAARVVAGIRGGPPTLRRPRRSFWRHPLPGQQRDHPRAPRRRGIGTAGV
ncbi:MAG: diguanylate cyclase [Gemmatimonadetes bacterium]|nr:diguanylate cyclase [Gemmatimonadota bacterium]